MIDNNEMVNLLIEINLLKDLLYLIYDHIQDISSFQAKTALDLFWNLFQIQGKDSLESLLTEDVYFIVKEIFLRVI